MSLRLGNINVGLSIAEGHGERSQTKQKEKVKS